MDTHYKSNCIIQKLKLYNCPVDNFSMLTSILCLTFILSVSGNPPHIHTLHSYRLKMEGWYVMLVIIKQFSVNETCTCIKVKSKKNVISDQLHHKKAPKNSQWSACLLSSIKHFTRLIPKINVQFNTCLASKFSMWLVLTDFKEKQWRGHLAPKLAGKTEICFPSLVKVISDRFGGLSAQVVRVTPSSHTDHLGWSRAQL